MDTDMRNRGHKIRSDQFHIGGKESFREEGFLSSDGNVSG